MHCCWCCFSFSGGLFVWKGVWRFLFICLFCFVCSFVLFVCFVCLFVVFFLGGGCEAIGGGIDIKLEEVNTGYIIHFHSETFIKCENYSDLPSSKPLRKF